jgi:hypothetical protein
MDFAKWRFTKAKISNSDDFRVEMLVVHDVKYSELAKITCLSFLHHHPKALVTINCDLPNSSILRNSLHREIKRGQIAINEIGINDRLWQQVKLELIVDLSGTNKIFMDADLKWNGSIQEINNPKVFTIEFAFSQKSPYRQIEQKINGNISQSILMLNTSFLTFNGRILPEETKLEILKLHANFSGLIDTCDLGIMDKPQVMRMSEQIVLSIFLSRLKWFDSPLKEIDIFKDGAFVESSYYGASGGQFY